jgi:hypothetical protein
VRGGGFVFSQTDGRVIRVCRTIHPAARRYTVSNVQARLIASGLGLVAGAILCTTNNVQVNTGLGVLIISAGLFVVEYVRAQKP